MCEHQSRDDESSIEIGTLIINLTILNSYSLQSIILDKKDVFSYDLSKCISSNNNAYEYSKNKMRDNDLERLRFYVEYRTDTNNEEIQKLSNIIEDELLERKYSDYINEKILFWRDIMGYSRDEICYKISNMYDIYKIRFIRRMFLQDAEIYHYDIVNRRFKNRLLKYRLKMYLSKYGLDALVINYDCISSSIEDLLLEIEIDDV